MTEMGHAWEAQCHCVQYVDILPEIPSMETNCLENRSEGPAPFLDIPFGR